MFDMAFGRSLGRYSGFVERINVTFQHIYWEGNSSVDYLGKLGTEDMTVHWVVFDDIPKLRSGFLKIEKLGLPQLRT